MRVRAVHEHRPLLVLAVVGVAAVVGYAIGHAVGYDHGVDVGVEQEHEAAQVEHEERLHEQGPVLQCGVPETECPILTRDLVGGEDARDFRQKEMENT